MNKRFFDALGKLFAAEYTNRPVQSKAKVFTELEAEGYCYRFREAEIVSNMVMKVEGWAISQLGHLVYCEACGKLDLDELECA